MHEQSEQKKKGKSREKEGDVDVVVILSRSRRRSQHSEEQEETTCICCPFRDVTFRDREQQEQQCGWNRGEVEVWLEMVRWAAVHSAA